MQAMLEVDEHHWWYRGRRADHRRRARPAAAPRADARVLDAGCGSGRTLHELVATARSTASSSTRRRPRWRAVARRVRRPRRPPRGSSRSTTPLRPDHLPRCDRAHPRRHADAARAAPCLPAGRLAARDRAGLSALWSLHDEANHHFRRYSRASLRRAALAAGWTIDRVSVFNCLLLRRPRSCGSPSGGSGPATATPTTSTSARAGSTTCSSSRCALEAGWLRARPHAPGRSVAARRRSNRSADARPEPGRGRAHTRCCALAAIISVSSSLGYLLPAIIGLESLGVPSPGETALVLAAVLASQGKLQHLAA